MADPPLSEHVRQAAVDQLVHAFGIDVAVLVHPERVLRKVLRRMPPGLLAAGLAVEDRVVAGAIEGPVLGIVDEREALMRADRREPDDVAVRARASCDALAHLDQD